MSIKLQFALGNTNAIASSSSQNTPKAPADLPQALKLYISKNDNILEDRY